MDKELDIKARLSVLRIPKKEFESESITLEKMRGIKPPINDVAWSLLNKYVVKTKNKIRQRSLYWEMAVLVASEGKNPQEYLELACEFGAFFSHDELKKIRELTKENHLQIAENLLMAVEKSPAVLNELRKISSRRAKEAKKYGDWENVIFHLEWYNSLARKFYDESISMVNQPPPQHTKTDLALMAKAKELIKEQR